MLFKMLTGWALALGLLTALIFQVLPKDDLKTVTSYAVDPVTLELTQTGGDSRRSDKKIWNQILELLPHEYLREKVVRFHLFSDGMQETLAYVKKTEFGADTWTLAVDRTDYRYFRDHYFVSTIVHEFAHLISLDSSQIAHFQWGCDNLVTVDGCFKTDAYLNLWYQQFWAGEMEKAYHRMVASVDKAYRDDAQERFFEAYSDAFVSEYASSDLSEDFAESFAEYVLGDKPVDDRLVYQQKILFFEQFPELVAVRDRIRSNHLPTLSLLKSDF